MHKRVWGRGCDELIINFTWPCYCFSIINAHFSITECDISSTAVSFTAYSTCGSPVSANMCDFV